MSNSNFRTLAVDYLEGINGERNYIRNAHAKDNTIGYNGYNDGSVAAPIDGTGGVVTGITFTRSTTAPLSGEASFEFAKDAVNRQGQGFAAAFTIDRADQAKVLQIEFDYERVSGTYVTGDLTAYIVDVTNNVVIQPSAFAIENVGTPSTARMTFQTSSNSVSYRLCFHVASISNQAYTLRLDNIRVSPQVVPLGAPVTDWQPYTGITLGWASNASYVALRRRVGDLEEYRVKVSTSGAPSGTLTLALNDRTIDTTKLPNYATLANVVGVVKLLDAGTRELPGLVDVLNATTLQLKAGNSTNGSFDGSVTATYPFTFASGDQVQIEFAVPIAGWSSSTVVSSSADTRVVACNAFVLNQTPAANTTTKIALSSTLDTHGGFSNANNRYTITVPGPYRILLQTGFGGFGTPVQTVLAIHLNGSEIQRTNGTTQSAGSNSSVSVIRNFVVGDFIEGFVNTGVGNANGINNSNLSIERLSGPSQIAASEVIAARYSTDASQNIANTGIQIVNFEDRTFDSHSAVTTGASWNFRAPANGIYSVAATLSFNSGVYTEGNNVDIYLYRNGTLYSVGPTWEAQTTTSVQAAVSINDEIQLVAGDTIDIRVSNSRAGGATALTVIGNQVSIKRLGGVM